MQSGRELLGHVVRNSLPSIYYAILSKVYDDAKPAIRFTLQSILIIRLEQPRSAKLVMHSYRGIKNHCTNLVLIHTQSAKPISASQPLCFSAINDTINFLNGDNSILQLQLPTTTKSILQLQPTTN